MTKGMDLEKQIMVDTARLDLDSLIFLRKLVEEKDKKYLEKCIRHVNGVLLKQHDERTHPMYRDMGNYFVQI